MHYRLHPLLTDKNRNENSNSVFHCIEIYA